MDERTGESGFYPQSAAEELGATAAAVALGARPRASRLNDKNEAFLEKQGRLVDLQIDGVQAQHHLLLSRLRWGRFSDWMKAVLQVLTAAVGAAVVLLVATMAWQAHETRGLVIDAFSVPPDLSRTGLTGEVAASRFVDKLEAMQTTTADSDRPAQSYQSNWGSDLKVEIPETGLTFSDFEKLLRDRLGSVSHVTGEVTLVPGGMSLTARLGDAPPVTFTGPVTAFDELAQKSAEAVYRANQPYRYAEYLDDVGRSDEAIPAMSELVANGPVSERGWAYAKWATMELNDHGDPLSARRYAALGLGYGPGSDLTAHIALVNSAVWSGHDEDDLAFSTVLERETRERIPDTSDVFYEANKLLGRAWLDFVKADYNRSGAEWVETARKIPTAHLSRLTPAMAATSYALGHDLPAARQAMRHAPISDQEMAWDIALGAFPSLPRYWMPAETDDWQAALEDARAMDSVLEAGKTKRPIYSLMQRTWIWPLEALALARTGNLMAAQTLIQKTPLDCYLCIRVRGMIAGERHDWSGAERWFAAAVRQAPSLASAYDEWAAERLARGDPSGALKLVSVAEARNAADADAVELHGLALLTNDDAAGAAAQFIAADRLAPNWGRNHLKWGEALARSGSHEEAREQFRRAAELPLSTSDRTELAAQVH